MTRILGIAGPSASGKSTLARTLAAALDRLQGPARWLAADRYYRDRSGLSPAELEQVDFDHPEALELERLLADLQALRRGETVVPPEYDYARHARRPGREPLAPPRWLLLEGLFVLTWEPLQPLLDARIYVDLPWEACLRRRLQRDRRERGRSEEEIRRQFRTRVEPMGRKYVLPGRGRADLVVSGAEPVETSVERVLRFLRIPSPTTERP